MHSRGHAGSELYVAAGSKGAEF